MGMVIWFKRQDDPTGADDDRRYILQEAELLDALADEMGVRKLSSFFDYADVNANLAEEELDDNSLEVDEAWHEPAELAATLEALRSRLLDATGIPSDKEKSNTQLISEVDGCIAKAKFAIADGTSVHLCVVM